jgi:hypothetical protein
LGYATAIASPLTPDYLRGCHPPSKIFGGMSSPASPLHYTTEATAAARSARTCAASMYLRGRAPPYLNRTATHRRLRFRIGHHLTVPSRRFFCLLAQTIAVASSIPYNSLHDNLLNLLLATDSFLPQLKTFLFEYWLRAFNVIETLVRCILNINV